VKPVAIFLLVGLGGGGCRANKGKPAGDARATSESHDSVEAAAELGDSSPRQDRVESPPTRWAMWPMPNSPSSGLPHPQSYDTSVARTVLDRVTGLMWQRTPHPSDMVFDEANATCSRLDLAGYHDWRLPSRIELVSILDLELSQPSIDPIAFPRTPSDWFWTASVASDSPTAAWYVYFYFGYPKTDERSSRFAVRCVRTANPPSETLNPEAHYEVRAAAVRDVATGLTWQRRVPATGTFGFEAARAYCARLDLDGHRDWRVPSMPELLTLIDEGASKPAIDGTAFPGTPPESFWTASLFANKTAEAWHVYFDHGNSLYGLLKGTYRVRCVR
jgi:hypothetical protein